MDVDALKGCGINPGELASTNLLLGMLYKEAPSAASLSATAAKGFGGIGGIFTREKMMENIDAEEEAKKKARKKGNDEDEAEEQGDW
jgi:hypothetical protein